MGTDNSPRLQDLINLSILQKMQDSFTAMTGVASVITDAEGIPITERREFSTFCGNLTRCSQMGGRLCQKCASYGARESLATGRANAYYCHAGLMDFSAPIVVDGNIIGCFVGGQVLTRPPKEESVRRAARELGIDEDAYWEAAGQVKILDKQTLKRTADFVNSLSRALSNMANGKLLALRAQKDLEKADHIKSDFLANMSHEIRTPMNAVIGMADMALRQDLPPFARNYLEQIKSSGKALLNIINDVLDYSKIESGSFSITPEDYEPMSIINDVSTIIMNRIMHKNIEFLLDIDPKLPRLINGDCQRLRQILINLANNAVKFTDKGYVRLTMRFEIKDADNIVLFFTIRDTGIGIKKDDLSKLFNSFQQVDSKRNRHIEGTGLGLAIVNKLLNLMNGEIFVESEYGSGSSFSFTLPQKIVDPTPCIQLESPEENVLVGFFSHKEVAKDFIDDAAKIGLRTIDLSGAENPGAEVDAIVDQNPDKNIYIVVEQALFRRETMATVNMSDPRYDKVQAVLLADAFADIREWKDLTYLKITKKPVSVLSLSSLIGEKEAFLKKISEDEGSTAGFVAPDAKILLVDDNMINLTVAEGLLEPLQMQVDRALSGREALEKIENKKYDIIFMDHMMPEMDGVETTRIIRRFHPEYNEIPIIALTANAVSGAREMFLNEGMNDFVAKPIEYRVLESKVKLWLPPEKVRMVTPEEMAQLAGKKREVIKIGDLDTDYARDMLGSDKLFWNILKEYYRTIEIKASKVEVFFDRMDWPNYTIEVHSIKSASRQIGAIELSDLAARLEQAGNARNEAIIRVDTPDMLIKYRSYAEVLAPYFEDSEGGDEEKPLIDRATLSMLLGRLRVALDDLNLDDMEVISDELGTYSFPNGQAEIVSHLRTAISNIDVESCGRLMEELS